ncbi:hypothetical protein [Phytohabitans suffuscus]|uniref:hypothetical protein n=1 Tax=Phytohabitans suffuscus TaxID=624315 RepID=UPI001567B5AA|nr:hypothetical protein [Phytohabitans suffuscus]
MSDFERDVLRDKEVVPAELERARQIYLDCLAASGIRADQPEPLQPGLGGIVVGFDAPGDEESDIKLAAIDDCMSDVSAVQEVWILQNQLSEEQRTAAMATFVSCVRAAGLNLPQGTRFEDAVKAAQTAEPDTAALDVCLSRVTASLQTALPGLADALHHLDVT